MLNKRDAEVFDEILDIIDNILDYGIYPSMVRLVELANRSENVELSFQELMLNHSEALRVLFVIHPLLGHEQGMFRSNELIDVYKRTVNILSAYWDSDNIYTTIFGVIMEMDLEEVFLRNLFNFSYVNLANFNGYVNSLLLMDTVIQSKWLKENSNYSDSSQIKLNLDTRDSFAVCGTRVDFDKKYKKYEDRDSLYASEFIASYFHDGIVTYTPKNKYIIDSFNGDIKKFIANYHPEVIFKLDEHLEKIEERYIEFSEDIMTDFNVNLTEVKSVLKWGDVLDPVNNDNDYYLLNDLHDELNILVNLCITQKILKENIYIMINTMNVGKMIQAISESIISGTVLSIIGGNEEVAIFDTHKLFGRGNSF